MNFFKKTILLSFTIAGVSGLSYGVDNFGSPEKGAEGKISTRSKLRSVIGTDNTCDLVDDFYSTAKKNNSAVRELKQKVSITNTKAVSDFVYIVKEQHNMLTSEEKKKKVSILQKNINELTLKIEELEKKKRKTSESLSKISGKNNLLQQELENIKKLMNEIVKNPDTTEEEVSKLEGRINILNSEIRDEKNIGIQETSNNINLKQQINVKKAEFEELKNRGFKKKTNSPQRVPGSKVITGIEAFNALSEKTTPSDKKEIKDSQRNTKNQGNGKGATTVIKTTERKELEGQKLHVIAAENNAKPNQRGTGKPIVPQEHKSKKK